MGRGTNAGCWPMRGAKPPRLRNRRASMLPDVPVSVRPGALQSWAAGRIFACATNAPPYHKAPGKVDEIAGPKPPKGSVTGRE